MWRARYESLVFGSLPECFSSFWAPRFLLCGTRQERTTAALFQSRFQGQSLHLYSHQHCTVLFFFFTGQIRWLMFWSYSGRCSFPLIRAFVIPRSYRFTNVSVGFADFTVQQSVWTHSSLFRWKWSVAVERTFYTPVPSINHGDTARLYSTSSSFSVLWLCEPVQQRSPRGWVFISPWFAPPEGQRGVPQPPSCAAPELCVIEFYQADVSHFVSALTLGVEAEVDLESGGADVLMLQHSLTH